MTDWGFENVANSLRVTLCGGILRKIPCSRLAHVSRTNKQQWMMVIEFHNYIPQLLYITASEKVPLFFQGVGVFLLLHFRAFFQIFKRYANEKKRVFLFFSELKIPEGGLRVFMPSSYAA